MIEFDVETTGLQPHAGDRVFLAQFLRDRDPALFYVDDEDGRERIQQSLTNGHEYLNEEYRAWNTKFDLHFLDQSGFDLPPEHTWHDGMVAAHILDERGRVALQAMGDKMFGAEEAAADTETAVKDWLAQEDRDRRKASKKDGSEFVRANYSDVPRELMDPYAAHDVVLQRRVCDLVYPAVERNPEFRELYAMERRVLPAIFRAEQRGIPFDRGALVELEAALLPKLDEAHDKAVRLAEFRNFNPRSPAQISEALDRLDADTRFMTRDSKTKVLVCDEENLNACPHPLAETILEYRGIHKLWAMVRRILHGDPDDKKFPLPYLDADDLVHPNFRQVGARTGRMSCSNPNFQQIHRDDLRLRYCVQARPGKKLVCVDLDGIELRLLAAFAGEGAMLEMIRSGADPHQHTADMLGMPGRKRSTGAFESPRDQGKRMNYLKNYGGGLRAMRKYFLCSMDQARAYRNRYNEAYPEIRDLEARIELALIDKGYVKTPWGRRHRVVKNAEQESYKFLARLVQGTAGDLFKDASAKVHEAGVPLIAFVHDELIAEVDAADAAEAGQVMVEALTTFPQITRKVPLEAEAQIVDRWSDAKKEGWVPDHAAD